MSKKDNPFEDILNDFVFPRMKDDFQKDKVKNTIKNVFEAVQGVVEEAQEAAKTVDVEVKQTQSDDPDTKNIHVEIKSKKKKKHKEEEAPVSSNEVDQLKAEVKMLKSQLGDKEEIISLLKQQIEMLKS
ncbi:hypothetical protein EI427_20505 [Flammeovirga pectinis]|uniref:Uncharacterized protein n=1 Tax=Flammeovirga pectinis TaxID=2494373 RepID=A0A3Q9FU45_9BACT|nr:hypothetical protein [Flammeovirga pectinis]AZQ64499.1 hypothetical protein EI427_20505 [Flammeovirga pectinis]